MHAEELNRLILKHAERNLQEMGFKKSGVHYYLHSAPNIIVFHKKTFRGSFEGFYIACTHDFIKNTENVKGKLKIPPYLECFPVSISVEELEKQYGKYRSSKYFDCDMNFVSREVLPIKKRTKKNIIDILISNRNISRVQSEEYIKYSIEILLKYGMRFFAEYSPQISLLALNKYAKNYDSDLINNLKREVLDYMEINNLKPINTKWFWLNRFGL